MWSIFSCTFQKRLSNRETLRNSAFFNYFEIVFFQDPPWFKLFSIAYSRTSLEGRCPLQPLRSCEFEVPLGRGFQLVVTGNVHKAAALLHALLWFLWLPEP